MDSQTENMRKSLAALVPIKAHSERVPDKNVKEFNGRPLFHWILNTLRTTDVVDELVVNTSSKRVAREAREQFEATVIDRPEHLRGDAVSMNKIILHDVKQVDHDQFLQTHCTNPLLRPETVERAVAQFRQADCDSLFSVTPFQTRLWDEKCEPVNHERDQLQRTQDLPPLYEENSNIYLFTQSSVERRENRIGNNPVMFEMEAQEAIDIDEPVDFRMAEFFHKDQYGTDPKLDEVVQ